MNQAKEVIKSFKNVKLNDYIFTIKDGWTKVVNIEKRTQNRICTGHLSYTLEGKRNHTDIHPSAWTIDVFNGTEPPQVFEEGEIICVYNGCTETNRKYEPFIDYTNGYFCTGVDEENVSMWNNARKLTPKERGIK